MVGWMNSWIGRQLDRLADGWIMDWRIDGGSTVGWTDRYLMPRWMDCLKNSSTVSFFVTDKSPL